MKNIMKHTLRHIGYDLVKVPYPESHGRELKNLIERQDINCVLDVGARHGEFASWLREIGFSGHICSFEPVAENFRELSRRMGCDKRWMGFNLALGETGGEQTINVTAGSAMSSFLEPNAFARQQFTEDSVVLQGELVRMAPLRDVMEKVRTKVEKPRCLLKLDTQGYDLKVMRGAESCLEFIVALQSEVSIKPIYEAMPGYAEAIGEYQSLGFELVGLHPVKRDRGGAVIEFDCLMQRAV